MTNEKIASLAHEAISHRVFPGCVVGYVKRGERTILPFGTLAYNNAPVHDDTMYDVASVTKSIPVASLSALMIEEEMFALTDLVRTYIPEIRNDHAATIEDLLRYRVYGPAMSQFADLTAKEIHAILCEHGFTNHPGESRYSNLPAYLLGLVIERVSGKRLDELAASRFFEPLSMWRTSFCRAEDAAPTEVVDGRIVRNEPHDESARAFAREGIAVGHAGLFSTAPDLLNFLESLLADTYKPVVKAANKGLGWQCNEKAFMGSVFGPRTFGKTGFTGTAVVCDCDRGIGIVILSNRTYPNRPEHNDAINAFRASVVETVFQNGKS